MKKLLLLTIAMLSLNAWAEPDVQSLMGKDRGGGDPILIQAAEFTDQANLKEAIDLALLNFQVVAPDLAEAFRKEANDLHAKKYFLVLPSILVHRFSELKDYKDLNDVHDFYELGGYTESKIGAPIYFSERVGQYPLLELAANVTHEVLHHILPESLNEEQFVRDLTRAILYSENNIWIQSSLRSGIVIREDFVSGRSLAIHYRADLNRRFGPLHQYMSYRVRDLKYLNDLERAGNIYSRNAYDTLFSLHTAVYRYNIAPNLTWAMIATYSNFYDLTKLANPKFQFPEVKPLKKYPQNKKWVSTCRKYKGGFLWQKCVEPMTFGEILVPTL